jgi:nitronate monooxygenase/enoyl-[acyl-carrier protein] reductase II
LDSWEAAGRPAAPERPGEGEVVAVDAAGRDHHRYEDLMPLPGMTGDLGEMALYAGQSVELVNDVRPAGALLREITAQTVRVIERLRDL